MKETEDPVSYQSIAEYFAEMRVLRNLSISGYALAGVVPTPTVANHVLRAAQIAYILASLEGADPEKTACIVLFHDNGETRVTDQNKVAARYLDISEAERLAYEDQISGLPEEIRKKLLHYYLRFEQRDTKEGIVAKDADWLEAAITAKELLETGHSKGLQNWINNVRNALETESAQEILKLVEATDNFMNGWWEGLKKMTYKKLDRE